VTTYELDLIGNALDSLAEALAKFEDGDEGNEKSFKFAVLHMAHFVELIFKYYIEKTHPLLIYKNPHSERLDRGQTITFWDAVNFISNEDGRRVSKEFRNDLSWLKKLRNDIEHHKVQMNVEEVRQILGRVFQAVLAFLGAHSDLDVEAHIPKETMETFKRLSDEYLFRLHDAVKKCEDIAAEFDEPMDPEARPSVVDCSNCGNPTFALDPASATGYQCLMCGSHESDEMPMWCASCNALSTRGELFEFVTGPDYAEYTELRCYYCSGRYHADKDD
jgi:hypothetical protein